jgi:hypothetical protein
VARETGIRASQLRWVWPGPFELAFGDRVAVRERDDEWLGEVVLPAARLVEWPEQADLPEVSRRVPDAEWPSPPPTDGRQLLESLELPAALLAWQWPGASARPMANAPSEASSASGDVLPETGSATQHERADQESAGEQGEHR